MSDDELDALERLLLDGEDGDDEDGDDEDVSNDGSEVLFEAADALREKTAAEGPGDALRAQILASLGRPSAEGLDVCVEAAEALRLETDALEGTPDVRARVLRGVRAAHAPEKRARWAAWPLAAASLLVLFVGGSSALAATRDFDGLASLWSELGERLGLEREEAAREVRPPARPQTPSDSALPEPSAGSDSDSVSAAHSEPEPSPVAPIAAAPAVRRPPRPRARAPRVAPPEASPARAPLEPVDEAEHAAFTEADRLHRSGRPDAALAAWDRYLERYPSGRYGLESRYNRALTLVRLGREAQALEALAPFVEGVHGGYRQRSASALSERLRARLDGP